MKTLVLSASEESIGLAVQKLIENEVICFPTDTVYGIGANVYSDDAVNKIYHAKGRPDNKPILVLVGENYNISNLVSDIPDMAKKLMTRFWPGALTIIFNSKNNISEVAAAGAKTIGLRVPNDRTALKILEKCNIPLATTSANISDMPSPVNASQVYEYMNGKVPLIIDGGECYEKIASTIVDVTEDEAKILRLGAITAEEIYKVLGN